MYVAGEHTFTMNGGSISGNQSSKGAVYAEGIARLSFSGDASVTNNTFTDGTTAMNVYLDYHSNAIINASDLTGSAPIGVYVASGDDGVIYNNHGIAGRPFGTGSGEYLSKFVNDKDNSLRGTEGPNGLMIWPGKDLLLQVYVPFCSTVCPYCDYLVQQGSLALVNLYTQALATELETTSALEPSPASSTL